jgi:hypothetical protein
MMWPAVPDKISKGAANMEDHETRRKIIRLNRVPADAEGHELLISVL